MLRTFLIVAGVFIGMGAASLAGAVRIGMEVRGEDGALIGRVTGMARDERGMPIGVTIHLLTPETTPREKTMQPKGAPANRALTHAAYP